MRIHGGNTNNKENTLIHNTFLFHILQIYTNLYELADSKNVRVVFSRLFKHFSYTL